MGPTEQSDTCSRTRAGAAGPHVQLMCLSLQLMRLSLLLLLLPLLLRSLVRQRQRQRRGIAPQPIAPLRRGSPLCARRLCKTSPDRERGRAGGVRREVEMESGQEGGRAGGCESVTPSKCKCVRAASVTDHLRVCARALLRACACAPREIAPRHSPELKTPRQTG